MPRAMKSPPLSGNAGGVQRSGSDTNFSPRMVTSHHALPVPTPA